MSGSVDSVEWKSRKTAPRTGKVFIGLGDLYAEDDEGMFVYDAKWRCGSFWRNNDGDGYTVEVSPMYWMHEPKRPKKILCGDGINDQ